MIYKEKKNFRKKFIVADLVSLKHILWKFSNLTTENISSADFIQTQFVFLNSFKNAIGLSNGLDPDQALQFLIIGPDMGLNCLQRC